jgi:hypothetical protein
VLRAHTEALPLLTAWTNETHAVLADLGYAGEQATLTIPIKRTAERGNSLLKTSFKALRRLSLYPWRIQGSCKVSFGPPDLRSCRPGPRVGLPGPPLRHPPAWRPLDPCAGQGDPTVGLSAAELLLRTGPQPPMEA